MNLRTMARDASPTSKCKLTARSDSRLVIEGIVRSTTLDFFLSPERNEFSFSPIVLAA